MASVRSDVDEIKKRANIVDVVSEYVTLRKTGINHTGLCPFHKEKTPSFSVNVDKQIFYCFGCGEGGDVFAFLMKINQMDFPEALRHLAGKLGIVLSGEYKGKENREQKSLREEIYRVNRIAADYFARNLFSAPGKEARAYLAKRRLREEVVQDFHLGYCLPGWRHLRGFLEKERLPLKLLVQAGLVVARDDGDGYDRFRGRLMFPIEGVDGRVVAFGGRSLAEEMPKYLNSPESPVYVKGKNLYGLSRAREEIRRKDEVILVEGYFDFLQLWNAGIRNVAATLGTALTRDHLDLLRRYSRNVYLLFDPDEGGRNAMERSLRLFVAEKIYARVVLLPERYDPDSFVLEFGREALEDLLSRSPSLVDYYIDQMIGTKDSLEKRLDAVRNAIVFMVQVDDVVQRNLFIKRVSERLGIEQELLKSEVRKVMASSPKPQGKSLPPGKIPVKSDPVEVSLLHLLMEYPARLSAAREQKVLDYLVSDDLKVLGQTLLERYEQDGKIAVAEMVAGIPDETLRKQLLERVMAGCLYSEDRIAEKVFTDTVQAIKRRWFRERHKALKRELTQAQEKDDQPLCKRILMEKERLMREEKALSFNNREKS